MADLSVSFDPDDIAAASDAASSALAAASDAASKATVGTSKASDASSAAIVAYSKASDASSAAQAGPLYARNATQQIISNSNTETTIFSAAIAGGAITSTGMVRCRINATYVNNVDSTKTVTIKIKYGSTTLYGDTTPGLLYGTGSRPIWIEFILANQNATNSQILNGLIMFGLISEAVTGTGTLNTDEIVSVDPLNGVSSEDSTGTLNLVVTIQHSSASASITWTTNWVSLERWA